MTDKTPMIARDYDDPELVADRRWSGAIRDWLAGKPEGLCAAILDAHLLISNDARQFLADLAAGKVQRSNGRPLARTPAEERELTGLVYAEWEAQKKLARRGVRGQPAKRTAIELVAAQRRISYDQLRGIVDKVSAAGLTRSFWKLRGPQTFTR